MKNPSLGQNVTSLNFVLSDMQKMLSMNRVRDFEYKAKKIQNALNILKKIIDSNKDIPFSQRDIFENEYNTYLRGFVSVICVFDGKLQNFSISSLQQDCSVCVTKDGIKFNKMANLKVGNQAIGQAWLQSGQEVFVPEYAVNHSMNSTATRVISWALLYKREIQRKTIIH